MEIAKNPALGNAFGLHLSNPAGEFERMGKNLMGQAGYPHCSSCGLS
jgi:hypothetical protein